MAEGKKEEGGASYNDIAEFMQKMWNPFGVPVPGFGLPGSAAGVSGMAPPFAGPSGGLPFPNPATMFATLDPAEVARAAASPELAAEMYLASLLVTDETGFMERAYLDELARQLGLPDGLKRELERQALAAKVQDLRNQLFTVSNRTDGSGNYLFSGGNNVNSLVPGVVSAP